MRFACSIKSTGGFILCILITCRVWATPLFPQETDAEDEDDEEEDEDAYDEEENTSKKADGGWCVVCEKEELDSGEKEDAAVRELLSKRLGITNFSSKALAEKATHFAIKYIVSRSQVGQPTPRPRKKVKFPPLPIIPAAVTTKKSKITKNNTSVQEVVENGGNQTNNQTMRTFVITVPHELNGTGGGIIEINIPTMMISTDGSSSSGEGMPDHHTSQMSISSEDVQGIKNIEAAIMEALILAQQMTPMTLSTSISADNNTETIELDIDDISAVTATIEDDESELNEATTPAANKKLTSRHPSVSPSPLEQKDIPPERKDVQPSPSPPEQKDVQPPPSPPEQKDIPPPPLETIIVLPGETLTSKPTRRRKVRSTTPESPIPGDPLAVGPLTDGVVSQIRNGKLPQFLWKSVVKLAGSKYAQIAVDAVECAVFYYCPDDVELGTLSNGATF